MARAGGARIRGTAAVNHRRCRCDAGPGRVRREPSPPDPLGPVESQRDPEDDGAPHRPGEQQDGEPGRPGTRATSTPRRWPCSAGTATSARPPGPRPRQLSGSWRRVHAGLRAAPVAPVRPGRPPDAVPGRLLAPVPLLLDGEPRHRSGPLIGHQHVADLGHPPGPRRRRRRERPHPLLRAVPPAELSREPRPDRHAGVHRRHRRRPPRHLRSRPHRPPQRVPP